MVLNGAIGAKLHIPFSVAIRASFGYYFAYFCIVSRCILAMFWYVLYFHTKNLRKQSVDSKTSRADSIIWTGSESNQQTEPNVWPS